MALCIGAAISLFTVVRSVLLRPLPFRDPAQLVMVYEDFRGGELSYQPVAPADFYDWRSKTHGFEEMAIMRPAGYELTGVRNEVPESVGAETGSSNLLSLLGKQSARGRDLTDADDRRGSAVVMLTWSLFERRFAGDTKIVGRDADGGDARQSQSPAYQHFFRGAPEPYAADVGPQVHAVNERAQQKACQSRSCDCAALHALKVLPDSSDIARTPAMEAGLSDHVWGIEELVSLLP